MVYRIANTDNEDKNIIIVIVTLELSTLNTNFPFLSCFTIFQIKSILFIIKAII